MMRLTLNPLPGHPDCYILATTVESTVSANHTSFMDEVLGWLADRGVRREPSYHSFHIVRLTDDQAFETRMRWG